MSKLLLFLFLPLILGCFGNNSTNTNEGTITNDPYDIEFQVETLETNQYNLVVNMELGYGSRFISPFSMGEFLGKFNISIEDNAYLVLDSLFTETPSTVEEFDGHLFINDNDKWVRENTSYKHELHLISKDDFEVDGLVKFVIEPQCTLEEIEFTISYQDGQMDVQIKNASI